MNTRTYHVGETERIELEGTPHVLRARWSRGGKVEWACDCGERFVDVNPPRT
jgi:hypothetical protein